MWTGTYIDRLRARAVAADAGPALRVRLAHLLEPSEIQPAGLPPAAILVVRRLDDPLPGRLRRSIDAGALVDSAWETAARSALGSCHRRAVRPALGPVPSGADAVLFLDRAEMLACLARDLVSGASLAWWWRALLGELPRTPAEALAAVWVREPEFVPAALECLAQWGESARVLASLTVAQAWELLAAVARAFGFPALVQIAAAAAFEPGPLDEESPAAADREGQSVRPPWEPFVAESLAPASLAREQRALAGVALLIRRATRVAVTTHFARRFASWYRLPAATAASPEQSGPAPVRSAAPEPSEPPAAAPWDTREPAPLVAAHGRMAGQPARSRIAPLRSPKTAAEEPAALVLETQQEPRGPVDQTTKSADAGLRTEAGGVLFLVNLGRALGVLGGMDTGLSGWEMIELLGRGLCGPGPADDPLWAALAALDGRAPEVPAGAGFRGTGCYRAPAAWLAPPFTRELRRRARRYCAVRPLGSPFAPPLRRFMRFLLGYVRVRLSGALRIDAADPQALRRALLARVGTLYVTRTHVDLVMGLDQATGPVRLAGLDANPGWVPELGRVLTFHFVDEAGR